MFVITAPDALPRSASDVRPRGLFFAAMILRSDPQFGGLSSVIVDILTKFFGIFLKESCSTTPMLASGDREISLGGQICPTMHRGISVSKSE